MTWIDYIGFGPAGRGPLLLAALLMTLEITLSSVLFGAVLGAMVAAAKMSRLIAVRAMAETYTTVFRGAPELLVIYLVYFGGSQAVTYFGRLMNAGGFLGLPSFLAGTLAVGLISGSYQAEVFRGAYRAVSPGETEAAAAAGMSPFLRFRRIIAPQVLRFALPGLGNVWQLSLKDSALVSVTGLAELMRVSQTSAGSTHQYFTFFIAGGCLYLVLTTMSDRLFGFAEKRVARTFRSAPGRD